LWAAGQAHRPALLALRFDLPQHAKLGGFRLVMISGNIERIAVYESAANQLLQKPFTHEQLDRAIQLALASDVSGQRTEDPN
jgi:hypothetical protein